MDKEQVRGASVMVLGRILESAAFLFTDSFDVTDRPEIDTWDCEGVQLAYTGHSAGYFHLWTSRSLARCAAANMLGCDEQAAGNEAKMIDALKELLNMIAGNMLTQLYGNEPVFRLGIPQQVDRETLGADTAADNAVWLEVEQEPLLFIMREHG
jgi:hypothetical protein